MYRSAALSRALLSRSLTPHPRHTLSPSVALSLSRRSIAYSQTRLSSLPKADSSTSASDANISEDGPTPSSASSSSSGSLPDLSKPDAQNTEPSIPSSILNDLTPSSLPSLDSLKTELANLQSTVSSTVSSLLPSDTDAAKEELASLQSQISQRSQQAAGSAQKAGEEVKEKAEETKEEAGRLLGMGKDSIGELVQEVKEKTVELQERGEVMKEGAMKSVQEGREKAEEVREEVAGTAGEVKGKIEEGVEVGKEQAEEMRKKAEAEGLVADGETLKEAAAAGLDPSTTEPTFRASAVDAVKEALDKLKARASEEGKSVQETASDAIDRAQSSSSSLIDEAKKAFTDATESTSSERKPYPQAETKNGHLVKDFFAFKGGNPFFDQPLRALPPIETSPTSHPLPPIAYFALWPMFNLATFVRTLFVDALGDEALPNQGAQFREQLLEQLRGEGARVGIPRADESPDPTPTRPGRPYTDAQRASLLKVYTAFERRALTQGVKSRNAHVTVMHEAYRNNPDPEVVEIYEEIWGKFSSLASQPRSAEYLVGLDQLVWDADGMALVVSTIDLRHPAQGEEPLDPLTVDFWSMPEGSDDRFHMTVFNRTHDTAATGRMIERFREGDREGLGWIDFKGMYEPVRATFAAREKDY